MSAPLFVLLAVTLFLTGCEGVQSMLDPKGPQAERIASLWWVMLVICTIVLAAVCVLVLAAVLRARRSDTEVALSKRQKWGLVLTGGVAAPTVVLLGLLVYSVAVGRAMVAEPANPVRVEVVAHQWWWRVSYPGQERTDLNVTTANEIHVPVGRPAAIELTSRDVIHSFWVPNLHGKTDVIPGHRTRTWIQADAPGVWRGQCAEYCGLQHAHMAFYVVAHEPADFERWLATQREPARDPEDPVSSRGKQVFLAGPCVMCHTVRGTPALSNFGPDLTHVASRRSLAAGTVPNTRGHLAGWILDPQVLKPGTRMPPTNLAHDELQALLAYLDGLR